MNKKFKLAIRYLIKSQVKTSADLDSAKTKIAKKFKITTPSNVELLKAYHNLLKNKRTKSDKNLEIILRTRKIRSLSGIVNISVLTKPYPCPGKCIYCPTQKGIPKSYLKGEPAVQRAILTNFDPYLQVQVRLKSLKTTGHPTDKIELRIIGGTWSYYPKNYQTWFITSCFKACNKNSKLKTKNLEQAQKINEKVKHRIVGISIETRPDFITESEIKRLRELGVTRVELGVQSIYDDVLEINKRGHKVEATIKATKLLKDAGFKVSYQMMPNLPGSNLKKDIGMFKELFSNPNFKPDLLKIYPLALVKETALYKKRSFKPYSKEKLIRILLEIKKQIPYWCRIERIMRDIPSKDIIGRGAKISNLREIVQKEMEKQGLKCRCIRCREVKENYNPKEKIYLYRQNYGASGGKEIFLSYENKKRIKLYALLRLRISGEVQPRAVIREVHTYGQMLPISRGPSSVKAAQHKGLGKNLIKEAEKITKKEFNIKKIAAISGIGARDYFSNLKYKLENTYMVKKL